MGFELVPSASEPCCLAHWSMGISIASFSKIIEVYDKTEIQTWTYFWRNLCPDQLTHLKWAFRIRFFIMDQLDHLPVFF